MKQTFNIFRSCRLLQIQVLAVLLSNITSCNFGDPSIETLANYNFNYYNNNQVSVGGEYLNDSIYVQVYSNVVPSDVSGFTVKFRVTKGGGKIDQQVVKTNKNGKAATRWKLGTDSFSQIVTVQVTDLNGNVYPGAQVNAYGMLYNDWNQVDYSPLNQLSDLVSDTISKQSWMIFSNRIYKLGANFLDWQSSYNQPISSPREIEIDKNGIIYVGTWNGELYKSTDHGQTWIKCTKPMPDRPYSYNLWVTNDGDLWATVYENGLRHSKDGGITWLNPANGADKNTIINGMFRLKNNWIVSLGQTVMKSEDDGKTWAPLATPIYPYSLFVTENDEIIVFTQSNGGIYKSTDLGKTYQQVYSASVAFNTSSTQPHVLKFGADYYLVIPGYGILKTNDFEHFETLLSEPYIYGIFADHTGSIYAKGTLDKQNSTFVFARK